MVAIEPTPRHRRKISRGKRERVYVRDNWTCQYCGLAFDPSKRYVDKPGYAPCMSVVIPPNRFGDSARHEWICLEIDHIHPVLLGGTDDESNLRAACTPCNKRKLARTDQIDWDGRIAEALKVLLSESPSESVAKKAAALLIGCRKSELPRVRGALNGNR